MRYWLERTSLTIIIREVCALCVCSDEPKCTRAWWWYVLVMQEFAGFLPKPLLVFVRGYACVCAVKVLNAQKGHTQSIRNQMCIERAAV